MEKDILALLSDGKVLDFIEISDALGLSKEMDELNSSDIASVAPSVRPAHIFSLF